MTQTRIPVLLLSLSLIACGDDAAAPDTGAMLGDAGIDGSVLDSGQDSSLPDGGGLDAVEPDGGSDAGPGDAGPGDAGPGDAGPGDAGPAPDGGPAEQLFGVPGENLLPEPSVETQASWTLGTVGHVFTSERANTGSRSMQLTSDGAGTVTTYSELVDLVPGQEYVASAFVAAQNLIAGPNGGGDTPILLINQRRDGEKVDNANGRHTDGYRWAPYPSQTYAFTDDGMAMQFQIVEAANQARIGARTWVNNTSGRTWWDDFEIVPLTFPHRGAELIVLQAEDSELTGGDIDDHELDFTGTGYVDVSGDPGATMAWPALTFGGAIVISVRYSREGRRTPMSIFVNGMRVPLTLLTVPTGRRGIYGSLDVGLNVAMGDVISLEVGHFGGELSQPLIDKVSIYRRAGM